MDWFYTYKVIFLFCERYVLSLRQLVTRLYKGDFIPMAVGFPLFREYLCWEKQGGSIISFGMRRHSIMCNA